MGQKSSRRVFSIIGLLENAINTLSKILVKISTCSGLLTAWMTSPSCPMSRIGHQPFRRFESNKLTYSFLGFLPTVGSPNCSWQHFLAVLAGGGMLHRLNSIEPEIACHHNRERGTHNQVSSTKISDASTRQISVNSFTKYHCFDTGEN